ncbi:MAG: hypothetical protein M1820_002860 [Bogoriella megaspora]|nr:MAG: hypothetical protein M1820_002860 [Bogoriella megaspora]
MASVFSTLALPRGSIWRPKKTSECPITGVAQANDADEPHQDIAELNSYLKILVEVFPDVQPAVFREMLINLGPESRLEVVTEHLLKDKARWTFGRLHTIDCNSTNQDSQGQTWLPPHGNGALLPEDHFRSDCYKTAVAEALSQEFKSLSKSTISGVLAEHNYAYFQSRSTLTNIASKSWRNSMINFLTRKKPTKPTETPLVTREMEPNSSRPVLKLRPTASQELNREVQETIIAPNERQRQEEMESQDKTAAEQLSTEQAEEESALYECECCYTSTTFEQMSACTIAAHLICFRCVRHTVNQSIFGQNWASTVVPEKAAIRCMAPTNTPCEGIICAEAIKRALIEEKDGEDVWRNFEDRAASDSLIRSQVPLLKCPFCVFAVIDDVANISPFPTPPAWLQWLTLSMAAGTICMRLFPLIYRLPRLLDVGIAAFTIVVALGKLVSVLPRDPLESLSNSIYQSRMRLALRHRGMRLRCQNPRCMMDSCIICRTKWVDPHQCYDSELTSLRVHVERAMADVVKRTCPVCHTSFVKSSGCNKLRCVCGYTMCYVCRKHIRPTEGYNHYCQHFRAVPGRLCTQCDKCDLYYCEDEAVLMKRAKENAEKEWMKREGKRFGGDFKLNAGGVQARIGPEAHRRKGLNKWLNYESMLDKVVGKIWKHGQ